MNIKCKIKKALNVIKQTRNTNIREISYNSLKNLIKENTNLKIVDIRSPQEFAENRIKSAINIPLYDLERMYKTMLPNKNELIVLYCQYGSRSIKAYQMLETKGYTQLYSLNGGIESAF